MTGAKLLIFLNKTILKLLPHKSMYEHIFLYCGEKLRYTSQKLDALKITNGSTIIAMPLDEDPEDEGENKAINPNIKNNLNLELHIQNKLDDLISLILVSADQCIHTNLVINKYKTAFDLIELIYKHIGENYPQKSTTEFYFLYNGNKIIGIFNTLDSLNIVNYTDILMLEIEPLFKENLEIDTSIIINNDYHKNLYFDLAGLLRLCLLKEISIFFYNDLDYYKDKVSNKMKYILEVISGGNIDCNQTLNYIMSILGKLGGACNIIYFSKFIEQNTSEEDLIELFDILKDDIKIKINKKKLFRKLC